MGTARPRWGALFTVLMIINGTHITLFTVGFDSQCHLFPDKPVKLAANRFGRAIIIKVGVGSRIACVPLRANIDHQPIKTIIFTA